jgi:hypothetical protein
MSIRRPTLIAAALTLFAAACSDATAPVEARATVTVPDTLVASLLPSAAQWMQLTIPVSIRNTSSVPLTFFYCASRVEVQNGGSWTSVWSPYCALSSEQQSPIPPGETRVVSMTITASVAGNAAPEWGSPTVGGTYRLLAGLIPEGFSGTIPTVSSNQFVLIRSN